MNKDVKRLIEVALPIREISAESVRDKSLRHGHISTLHLWWARWPLAASRAVVFASLVPDPDAIAGEFQGDSVSTLYYVWANLYGISEQAWDDARLVVQIGGEDEDPFEVARRYGIFVVDGSKCRLALLADRADPRGLGVDQNPPFIDAFHRAMLYWKEENRTGLVSYLSERGLLEDGPFWKLAQALFEVLPKDIEDWKIIHALLSERETLKAEGKKTAIPPEQPDLL